ncbi:hypothetical protein ILUMI_09227 [Ignelater luminosus]|uniref:PRANC domain-containing protein n=1 Tax=Ignelater luminosus TaxID=2038154 RepID=A0A8K0D662_IGNLU|nr:hypothetical protein ILUMI_09227 [Ignelater luminosus]
MDRSQAGLLLHRSIKSNDFATFNNLLHTTGLNVDWQNEAGNTLLLTCLIWRRFDFVQPLLAMGANIMTINKRNITPLSYAIFYKLPTVQLLLEKSADKQYLYDRTLNNTKYFVDELKECLYDFKFYVINEEVGMPEAVVCIMTGNPLYIQNLAVRELNIYLDLLERDDSIEKCDLARIYTMLIRRTVDLNTAVAFRIMWSKFDQNDLFSFAHDLLFTYLRCCKFSNQEYVECLRLILAHPNSLFLKSYYFDVFETNFCRELFYQFAVRNVDKHHRMLIILASVQLQEVTIRDVRSAYAYFGFNEEVFLLLKYLDSDSFHSIFKFITLLESDSKLSVDNLANLNLIVRLNYRKLIYSIPQLMFHGNEIIGEKKKLLNAVPSLFELSRFSFQKSLVKSYNIKDLKGFSKVVENLPLPQVLKIDICQEPPINYVSEECVV